MAMEGHCKMKKTANKGRREYGEPNILYRLSRDQKKNLDWSGRRQYEDII